MNSEHANNNGWAPGGRQVDWAAAFASADPGRQWAAACSVARAVTAADRWVDSTALHEAACGAFDAVAGRYGPDQVPAAIGGARRALYWERQARLRLVPPVSMGAHRWRAQAEANTAPCVLVPLDDADHQVVHDVDDRNRSGSVLVGWLADRLRAAGWAWPVPAEAAVREAIEAAVTLGRDRAPARLRRTCPDLPAPVADGLVLLVAGSRRREPRAWPGVVWLHAHRGPAAAAADPGSRAVIAAAVAGVRARPALMAGAAVHRRPTAAIGVHRPVPAPAGGAVMPVERAEAIAS